MPTPDEVWERNRDLRGVAEPGKGTRLTMVLVMGPYEAQPVRQSAPWRWGKLRVGDVVRLRPQGGGDVLDIALRGRLATVESIEMDYEDRFHVVVIVHDDPGKEFGLMRRPGHRFFFSVDDVEPATDEEAR